MDRDQWRGVCETPEKTGEPQDKRTPDSGVPRKQRLQVRPTSVARPTGQKAEKATVTIWRPEFWPSFRLASFFGPNFACPASRKEITNDPRLNDR